MVLRSSPGYPCARTLPPEIIRKRDDQHQPAKRVPDVTPKGIFEREGEVAGRSQEVGEDVIEQRLEVVDYALGRHVVPEVFRVRVIVEIWAEAGQKQQDRHIVPRRDEEHIDSPRLLTPHPVLGNEVNDDGGRDKPERYDQS